MSTDTPTDPTDTDEPLLIDTVGVSEDELNQTARDMFPFPSFRDHQEEVLLKTLKALFIDGKETVIIDAPTGVGKCITGDTLVNTDDGLIPIRDVEPGTTVTTYDGEFTERETVAKFDKGEKDTRELTTSRGYTIEGTDEHRVKILNSDGELEWKYLGDVTEGDYVPMYRDGATGGRIQTVEVPALDEPYERYEKRLPESVVIDESMAAFLGWFLADGSLDTGTATITAAKGKEGPILTLGEDVMPGVAPVVSDYNNKSAVDVNFHSMEVRRLLRQVCYNEEGTKVIPAEIFASPPEERAAFLNGLFSGDGTYTEKHISYSAKGEEFAKDVQQLLLSVGIASQRNIKNGYDGYESWRLNITGAEVDRFGEVVGEFASDNKHSFEDLLGKERNTNLDVVPNVDGLIQSAWMEYSAHNETPRHLKGFDKTIGSYRWPSAGPRKPSSRQLQRIIDYLDTGCAASEQLQSLVDLPVFFDEVESIEESRAQVYDINVPETHNYVANGFISHNSPINVALGRVVSQLFGGKTFSTTPQKSLRTQLENDDVLNKHQEVLRARRDYICGARSRSDGGSYDCDSCPVNVGAEGDASCLSEPGCTYWQAKERAMGSDIAVLTFAFLIVDGMLPKYSEGGGGSRDAAMMADMLSDGAKGQQISFGNRDLLVVDEGHTLTEQVASLFAGITVSNWNLPNSVYGTLHEDIDEGATRIEDIEDAMSELAIRARDYVETHANMAVGEMDNAKRIKSNLDECRSFLMKWKWCLEETGEDRPWVCEVAPYERDGRELKRVELKPIDVDNFLEKKIWSRAEKKVISTATMPFRSSPKKWIKRLGLDPNSFEVVSAPMPFPKENRPIHTGTIIDKFSSGGDQRNWDNIVNAILSLARKHDGEKGVVHTASYRRAEKLAESLGEHRCYLHSKDTMGENLDASDHIERWQASDKQIFLSPSVMEGVDLVDDKCRWQVLAKVPFANAGAPRVDYLLNERKDWGWYFENCCLSVIQSVGRGVRHNEDHCDYYVLDRSFQDVMNRTSPPAWFKDAIVE